jgi:hypothetical protein
VFEETEKKHFQLPIGDKEINRCRWSYDNRRKEEENFSTRYNIIGRKLSSLNFLHLPIEKLSFFFLVASINDNNKIERKREKSC